MPAAVVSVLIPTYEPDPAFLRAALDSLVAQTETRWTAFIHDDASKEDVRAIVAPYLKDSRFTFVRGEKNLGIGGNWNACLMEAEAPYIQYLFQDDHWDPRYLETAVKILEAHPHIGLVAVEHDYKFEPGASSQEEYRKLKEFKREHIEHGHHEGKKFLHWWVTQELHPNVIGEPSFVMLRKTTIDAVGTFSEELPQFLDMEYWIRCLLQTDCYFVPEKLGFFRVHSSGASARNEETGAGIYDRLQCFEHLIALLPRGELRRETIAARNQALTTMARKFFKRAKTGKKMKAKGGNALRNFVLRHPFAMIFAVLRALTQTPSGAERYW